MAFATAAAENGCINATRSQLSAYEEEANVTCYSGGVLIYDGSSTGKINRADSGSDGYYFRDQATGRLREVSGDCNVDFGAPRTTTQATSVPAPAPAS